MAVVYRNCLCLSGQSPSHTHKSKNSGWNHSLEQKSTRMSFDRIWHSIAFIVMLWLWHRQLNRTLSSRIALSTQKHLRNRMNDKTTGPERSPRSKRMGRSTKEDIQAIAKLNILPSKERKRIERGLRSGRLLCKVERCATEARSDGMCMVSSCVLMSYAYILLVYSSHM